MVFFRKEIFNAKNINCYILLSRLSLQTAANSVYHPSQSAPQVIGIYKNIILDPASTAPVYFQVLFDQEYSTACIEKITCSR
jgi:hypothetical protein